MADPYTGKVLPLDKEPYTGEVVPLGKADKEEETNWLQWARTRGQKGLEGLAGTPRAAADLNDAALQWAGRQVGLPELGKTAGQVIRGLIPGGNMGQSIRAVIPDGKVRDMIPGGSLPSSEEIHDWVNKQTGLKDTNSPKSWGIAGKALDAGTEAAAGSIVMPGSFLRNLIPAFAGGASGEVAGEVTKGTGWETPARIIASLLGGFVGAGAQNAATSTAKGVTNIVASNARDAETQAARILGRKLNEDGTTMEQLIARQREHLPGTPLAAVADENVRGAVRGAYTMTGPARNIVGQGATNFLEGADARIAPVLDRISPLPPAEVRVPDLMQQAGQDARPLYLQSGVADLPQQVLRQQPGQPVTTQVPSLGPAPFATLTRPGPPVTSVVGTNSPVLQSPALRDFMGQSGLVQSAVNRTRELSAFRNEPLTSMAMLDKVYKDLGSLETKASVAGDGGRARDIGMERRQLAAHVEAENPVYGRALEAYHSPASLAEAAQLGERLAKANIDPREVRRQFDGLASDTHRREFLGGFAGHLRGKAGGTDRATPAERIWNSSYMRGKVEELFPAVTEAGPDNTYNVINTALQNERQAARNLRDVTKGSTTTNKALEAADVAGGDAPSTLVDVMHRGVKGVLISKAMGKLGALSQRAAEGRTQNVNAALARMTMETDPAAAVRTQGLVETARRQAAATDASRGAAYGAGATGGLLQQLGPADRILQGLLMGGP